MSRMVRSPGSASITLGMALTTIDAVAMSPWMPPEIFMSPLHAKLTVQEGHVTIRDLGSRNGT